MNTRNEWEQARLYAIRGNFLGFKKEYEAWKVSDTYKKMLHDERTFAINALIEWAGKKNKDITLYLINDGANPQIALNCFANGEDTEFVDALLARGASAKRALEFLSERREVGFFGKHGKNEDHLKHITDKEQSLEGLGITFESARGMYKRRV